MADFFDKKDIEQDDFFSNEDVVVDETPTDEFQELSLDSDSGDDISMLESAARGIAQGVTMGTSDELQAGAEGFYEDMRRVLGLSDHKQEPVEYDEFNRPIIPEEETTYDKRIGEIRQEYKDAEESNPATYMASDIAGGIAPALLTGGASAVAKAGQVGLKEAVKQGAKTGAKYGAASGVGYGEGEGLEGLAKDAIIGGTIGAATGGALPVAGKGLKKGLETTKGLGKGIVDLIPESEAIKAGFKYGKEGKKLAREVVDEDMKSLAGNILQKLKAAKQEGRSLEEIRQELDAQGIKIDIKGDIDNVIDDVQKIVQDDIFDISDKSLLPKLQELAGFDKKAMDMANRAEKAAIKKSLESQGKQSQAVIKGEKGLADRAMKSGDELETVSDVNRSMDDLEIPFETSDGQFGGARGKFKKRSIDPETGEEIIENYSKEITSDVTPYQPIISKILGPDGRPIVKTTDRGSGKVTAMVGDIENKVQRDLENMTVSEVERLRKQLNVLTDLAKGQGTQKDPIIVRAKQLAVKLKELTDDAVDATGDDVLIKERARMSDILSSEQLLGIDKNKAVRGTDVEAEKTRKLVEKFGFNKGFSSRDEASQAVEQLGEDVISNADQQRFEMFKVLNNIMGRDNSESISRSGLYKKAVGDLPNLAGRGTRRVSDVVGRVAKPVLDSKKVVTDLTEEEFTKFGNKLVQSENKGLQTIGQRLLDATQMEGAAKNQLLWSLSQSPAVRELIKRQAMSVEEDSRMMDEYLQEDNMEAPLNEAVDSGLDVDNLVIDPSTEPEREPSGAADIANAQMAQEKPQEEPEQDTSSSFDDIIAERESNHDYSAVNRLGYLGKYQFGGMALQDLGYKDSKGKWTGKDGINSKKEFLESEEAQENAFAEWKPLLKRYLKSKGAMDYVGQDFNGINVTEEGLMAAAHLVGAGAVNKMLKSGKIPQDANGTKATDYMKMFDGNTEETPSEESKVDLQSILNDYADRDIPSGQEAPEPVTEDDVKSIETSIDLANQLQSSGDATPVDQIEDLLEKINRLNISEEDINELEDDVVNMRTYRQGLEIKQKLRSLLG